MLTPLPGPVLLGESQSVGGPVALSRGQDLGCWRARARPQGQGCSEQMAQLVTNPNFLVESPD